jgi:hypothetical protein
MFFDGSLPMFSKICCKYDKRRCVRSFNFIDAVADMHKKKDAKLASIEVGIARGIEHLRRAQRDVAKLQSAGATKSEIYGVMVALGFGAITPEQFTAAESVEEILRLINMPLGCGKIAYEAYCKSFGGPKVEHWMDLHARKQVAWVAAAEAVLKAKARAGLTP